MNNIGLALEKINRDKAIEHFKMVLTIDPTYNQALLNLGRLLYEKEWFEEARKYLKEYCILDGSVRSALKMHIDCLIQLGLKRTAKKELEDMMLRDPDDQFVSNMLDDYISETALS